jgi:hypothetical protein
MKKIKKLKDFNIKESATKDELANSIGSGIAKCGCGSCAYEDGGPGFNLGMNFTDTDGPDCTWYSIM